MRVYPNEGNSRRGRYLGASLHGGPRICRWTLHSGHSENDAANPTFDGILACRRCDELSRLIDCGRGAFVACVLIFLLPTRRQKPSQQDEADESLETINHYLREMRQQRARRKTHPPRRTSPLLVEFSGGRLVIDSQDEEASPAGFIACARAQGAGDFAASTAGSRI